MRFQLVKFNAQFGMDSRSRAVLPRKASFRRAHGHDPKGFQFGFAEQPLRPEYRKTTERTRVALSGVQGALRCQAGMPGSSGVGRSDGARPEGLYCRWVTEGMLGVCVEHRTSVDSTG